MLNAIVIVMLIFLVSCSARFPATIIIQNKKILRGSASGGKSGNDVIFYVKNVDGLSCEGKMPDLLSEAHTEGTIGCSNKQKGHFMVNGKKASWVGEGKLDDGSPFVISIGR